jgi:hypothetical protein
MKLLGSVDRIDRMKWVPPFLACINEGLVNLLGHSPRTLGWRFPAGVPGLDDLKEPSFCFKPRKGVPGRDTGAVCSSSNYRCCQFQSRGNGDLLTLSGKGFCSQ